MTELTPRKIVASIGGYALHAACRSGNLERVRKLLDKGVNIEFRNERGNTPLMVAVKNEKSDIIGELVKRGAKKNARNKARKTAFDYAKKNWRTLSILLEEI